jgi:small subunit ribosomal protein S5
VPLKGSTIPHEVGGRFGAGSGAAAPASPAPASSPVARCGPSWSAAGIQDILTKSLGTTNPHNVVRRRSTP